MSQMIWADITSFSLGAHAEAEPVYQEAIAIFEMLGDRWGQALCLTGLAHTAFRSQRVERAIALAQAALSIYQDIGDPWRVSDLRSYLAAYAIALGDYRGAERHYQEGLATALEYGQRGMAAHLLDRLGQISQSRGDPTAARAYYERSRDLFRQTGNAKEVERASRNLEALERPPDINVSAM
jgi:tetratricopeptide (TPR) repeat protein